MSPALAQRLRDFVDRTEEMERFSQILDTADPPIMVVWGDGGMGKTSLLARMIHECANRSYRKAEVVWTDTRPHDYLAVMRKLRDDIDPALFKPFTDLVNFYTVPQYELKIKIENAGTINVGQNAQIENSNVGVIAGVYIQDVMLPEPRKDLAVPEAERMARLTDAFLGNLAPAVADGPPLVVFFDAVEKMSDATRKWVWGELLASIRDGKVRNIRFVLCGRVGLPDDLDREVKCLVEDAELAPLGKEDIEEYLAKRGVTGDCSALATMVAVTTGGNPLSVANAVDAFVKAMKKAKPDRG